MTDRSQGLVLVLAQLVLLTTETTLQGSHFDFNVHSPETNGVQHTCISECSVCVCVQVHVCGGLIYSNIISLSRLN